MSQRASILTLIAFFLAATSMACAPKNGDLEGENLPSAQSPVTAVGTEVVLETIQVEEVTGMIEPSQAEQDEDNFVPSIADQTRYRTNIVDTGQTLCYDAAGSIIGCPIESDRFYGQDAQATGNQPSYTDNGDGTITDNVTGLMWQRDPGEKISWQDALDAAETLTLGGYDDWRLPTIKELYSLIDFSGVTGANQNNSTPYINTEYFTQPFGDSTAGERFIDAQTWSSTKYVSRTMMDDETVFGVNFIDGRIKGYPQYRPGNSGQETLMVVRFVRGEEIYGENDFLENGDGTISDKATGLVWQATDDGIGRNWEESLAYCTALSLAGYDDWRLPNAKELQGIVDYTRSPDTTNSPALDPIFETTTIVDGNGALNYPNFWTSTTHDDGPNGGDKAVYIAFGESQGYMEIPPNSGQRLLLDVHGAGAQRSDPKSGDPDDYPYGHGPQGDVISIYNYVRCVRGGG